jgi:cation transport protein ChaC
MRRDHQYLAQPASRLILQAAPTQACRGAKGTDLLSAEPDPFVHHPVLRGLIADPLKSFFRTFRPGDLDERMKALGAPADWRHSDAEIEASRTRFLADHGDADLWVFGYGSLMWDPSIRFTEVRRGRVIGYARRFCLRDTLGGRGTREAPGLMAALDTGPGCGGVVFRIPRAHLDEETAILWRRELLAPAYRPVFADVTTAHGDERALAFVADRNAAMIRPDLSRAEQLRLITTGAGFLGSSLQYLENLHAHLEALGIEDTEIAELFREARAIASSQSA